MERVQVTKKKGTAPRYQLFDIRMIPIFEFPVLM